mmetsp:Transcript_53088/g.125624  ORF Transcript_53088/g.125624 Transcript_53088/m.125624 type:complete len:108 (+) Transcript_53088:16-339(+)
MDTFDLTEYLIIYYARKLDITGKKKIFLIRFFFLMYFFFQASSILMFNFMFKNKEKTQYQTRLYQVKLKLAILSKEIVFSIFFGKLYTKILFVKSIKHCCSFFDIFF